MPTGSSHASTPLSQAEAVRILLVVLTAVITAGGCGGNPDPESTSSSPSVKSSRPSRPVAQLLSAADSAYSGNAYDLAIAYADSARALAPDRPEVHFARGRILAEAQQLEEARAAFERVLELDSTFQGVRYHLGEITFRHGKPRRALEYYRAEARHHPSALVYNRIGGALVELGRSDSAAAAFHHALARDSSSATAHAWLAQLHQEASRLDSALDYARRAYELESGSADYQFLLGQLLYQTGRIEAAIPHLRAVSNKRPWHHPSHYNLGQALARMGRQDSARVLLEEADSLQNIYSSIEQLKMVVQDDPTRGRAWTHLGDLYRKSGQYEEAERAYHKAIRLDSTRWEVRNDLANLYLVRGDTSRAITTYRQILEEDSSRADIWLNLGVAYANSGDYAAARQAWKQVLQQRPDDRTARRYLDRLAEMDSSQ